MQGITLDLYADIQSGEEGEEQAPLLNHTRNIQTHNCNASLDNIHSLPRVGSPTNSWEEPEDTDTPIFQSAVFIEDGINYRSIHHRIDPRSLTFYQIYYSRYVQWFLGLVIFGNLALAFIEYPTSLSQSSDYRYRLLTSHAEEVPCGVTESIEFLCLVLFLVDCVAQMYLIGWRRFVKKPWLLLYAVMIGLSLVDLIVSLSFCNDKDSLGYTLRIRRFFRPLFFLLSSSIMKKYIKAIYLTLPQIFTVLVLLLLHIYVFTMIGLLIFPRPTSESSSVANTTNQTNGSVLSLNASQSHYNIITDSDHYTHLEGVKYFDSVYDAFVNLTVLLTTANHPDIRMPIYEINRFSAIYFIAFLLIGAYLIFNLLIAVIYNNFKGFFQKSLQSSFFRRRVAFRAAFTILARRSNPNRIQGQELASKSLIRMLLQRAKIKAQQVPLMYQKLETMSSEYITWKQFCEVFDLVTKGPRRRAEIERLDYNSYALKLIQYVIRHRFFIYFTYCASIAHVILVTAELQFEYTYSLTDTRSRLAHYNFFFAIYYVTEQILKIVFLGRREYFYSLGNLYEGAITLGLFILELLSLSLTHSPFGTRRNFDAKTYDVLIRTMNIFIVLRLLRFIPQIKSLKMLTATILDLVKNLRGFLGIIVVVYYMFALLGMELFDDVYGPSGEANSTTCGSYDNLEYYANNFKDFAASLVVLWDIMVVNNWYVYLDKFATDSRFLGWSKLYFIAWWLVSAVICANLFVSLVLDTFLTKWEAVHEQHQGGQSRSRGYSFRSLDWDSLSIAQDARSSDVHDLMRDQLVEPQEADIMHELQHHWDLQLV